MTKQEIIDELATLTDTIENTVDELNKRLTQEERFSLIVDLIHSLDATRKSIVNGEKIFQ